MHARASVTDTSHISTTAVTSLTIIVEYGGSLDLQCYFCAILYLETLKVTISIYIQNTNITFNYEQYKITNVQLYKHSP